LGFLHKKILKIGIFSKNRTEEGAKHPERAHSDRKQLKLRGIQRTAEFLALHPV
jgi:hypothetical protein